MRIVLLPHKNSLEMLSRVTGLTDTVIRSVRKAAHMAMKEWVQTLDKSNAKEGWKGKYREAIRIEDGGSPFEAVVVAEGREVNFIEKGIKSFDMKEGLLKGRRARKDKKGNPYNIVPFRQGVPGSRGRAMPQDIYDVAKELEPSAVTGINEKFETVRGDKTKARTFRWGERLETKKRRFAGMVRFPQAQKGRRYSQYFTFRVVSTKTPAEAWIYPDVKAIRVFEPAMNRVKPEIKKMFAERIKQKADDGLRGLGG